MLEKLVVLSIAVVACVHGKPIDEYANEIDHGSSWERKNPTQDEESDIGLQSSALPVAKNPSYQAAKEIESLMSSTDYVKVESDVPVTSKPEENVTTKLLPFGWFLTPIAQKLQLSPQTFFQDRINQLREVLNNFGISQRPEVTGKQLSGVNGLLHLVGANDSGFYTNRLEPAGFLGGNGWFANKGGILGGPGAILSTGSLLTDYPSSYRK